MNAEARAKRNEAIIAEYLRGDPLAEIAGRHGVTVSAIVHRIRRSGTPRRLPHDRRDRAIDAYLLEHWDTSNRAIAAQLGIDRQIINTRRQALRQLHDLPYQIAHLAPEERRQRDEAIVADLRAGMRYADIATKHRVGISHVTRLSHRFGLMRHGPRDTRGNHDPADRGEVYAGILADRAAGMSYAQIAERRKVSQGTISRVVNGHILAPATPQPPVTASASPHADAISWELVQSGTSADLDRLASTYHVTRDSLYHRAKYLRTHGWTCPLASKPCAVCGKPLLTRKQTGYQTMHPVCKRQRDNERLAGKGAEWAAEAQQRTQASAHAAGRPWTEDEDAYLIEHQTEAAEQLAVDLGRSIYAVNTRVHRLAEQGLIDTHARRSARAKARGFARATRLAPVDLPDESVL